MLTLTRALPAKMQVDSLLSIVQYKSRVVPLFEKVQAKLIYLISSQIARQIEGQHVDKSSRCYD